MQFQKPIYKTLLLAGASVLLLGGGAFVGYSLGTMQKDAFHYQTAIFDQNQEAEAMDAKKPGALQEILENIEFSDLYKSLSAEQKQKLQKIFNMSDQELAKSSVQDLMKKASTLSKSKHAELVALLKELDLEALLPEGYTPWFGSSKKNDTGKNKTENKDKEDTASSSTEKPDKESNGLFGRDKEDATSGSTSKNPDDQQKEDQDFFRFDGKKIPFFQSEDLKDFLESFDIDQDTWKSWMESFMQKQQENDQESAPRQKEKNWFPFRNQQQFGSEKDSVSV